MLRLYRLHQAAWMLTPSVEGVSPCYKPHVDQHATPIRPLPLRRQLRPVKLVMLHDVTTLSPVLLVVKALSHWPDAAPILAGVPVVQECLLAMISEHA